MPHKTKSLLLALAATHALVPRANPKNSRLQRTRLHEKPIDSDEMASLYQELRARQSDVEADRAQTLERWRTGGCSSTVAVAASDWVRRMAFDGGTVAFGTASGGVGCCRVGQGPSRADVVKAHPRAVEGQDLSKLHGAYDGGGVTAIDMAGRVVVSGGRGGQVQVHQAIPKGDSLTLEAVTTLDVSVGSTVSSVAVADDGKTLVACALDGSIQGFACVDEEWKATWSSKNDAAALTVILDEERQSCVVGFSDGEVYALDVNSGEELCEPFTTATGAGCRSLLVSDGHLFVGGADGSVVRRKLCVDTFAIHPSQLILETKADRLLPPHGDAVVAMCAPPCGGIVCTASRDGSIRVWDSAAREPRALYGFQGFKVWIGSLCASADTLISDGSDNAIIQHTFDRDAEARAPVDPSLERRG